MGTNISKQEVSSLSKTTNDVITEVLNNFEHTTEISTYSNQEVVVNLQGANIECDVDVQQDQKIGISALADTNNTLNNNIESELKNVVDKQIKQSLEQLNSGVNLFQTNLANVITNTQTELENKLKTIVQNSIKNVVRVNTSAGQRVEFNGQLLKCTGGRKITITQNMTIDEIAKNIAQNVVDNVVKNKAVNDLKEAIEQKVSQTNKGLDIMLGVIIVLLVIVGGGSAVFKSLFQSKIFKVVIILLVAGLLTWLGIVIYKRTRPDAEKAGVKR